MTITSLKNITQGVIRNQTKFWVSIKRNRGRAERTYNENIRNNNIETAIKK